MNFIFNTRIIKSIELNQIDFKFYLFAIIEIVQMLLIKLILVFNKTKI